MSDFELLVRLMGVVDMLVTRTGVINAESYPAELGTKVFVTDKNFHLVSEGKHVEVEPFNDEFDKKFFIEDGVTVFCLIPKVGD